MKNLPLLALAGLAISLALPAFAQQQDTVDPEIAEQIRALAAKYDEAFNKNDVAAVCAFITEDAVWTTPKGKYSGRQSIEADYVDHVFRYHSNNLSTKFDRIDADGNDVRATGTWSCTFQDDSGHTKHLKGQTAWVLVHEGDTWKIREDTYDSSAPY
jgi:uncharacterized protein (TIGR02246 family)